MADEVLFDLLHMELISTQYGEKDGKDSDITKLENIGFWTGYRLVERLTKDWPRFREELDAMKFICKEFWSCFCKKSVDKLSTNYEHGVYVIQENEFRFLNQITVSSQYLDATPKYTAFTCGLIRGALANLGITAVVTAEVKSPPMCEFYVEAQRA